MAVIFDLDQTLIDSKSVEYFRTQRKWNSIYPLIPTLGPYDQIHEIIRLLKENTIPVAIVTSSPEPYCKKVIDHWNWAIDATVCFYCTKNHKPHPEPILLAVERLGLIPSKTIISVGDHKKDIEASRAAGVFTVGCTWGIEDTSDLTLSKPDLVVSTTNELKLFLIEKFNITVS